MFLSIVSCCEALNFKIRGKFIESDIVFQFASINIHATIGVNGLVFMQGRTLWDMAYMEVAMLFSCKLVPFKRILVSGLWKMSLRWS